MTTPEAEARLLGALGRLRRSGDEHGASTADLARATGVAKPMLWKVLSSQPAVEHVRLPGNGWLWRLRA